MVFFKDKIFAVMAQNIKLIQLSKIGADLARIEVVYFVFILIV